MTNQVEAFVSMVPGLTVRGQRSDDWESLLGFLENEAVIRDSLLLPFASEDAIRDRYGSPPTNTHSLVAEAVLPSGRKSIAGLAWLVLGRRRRRHAAELHLIMHPDHAATAVEAGLLRAALDLADNWLGLQRIVLVVYTDQATAIELYHQHGFEIEVTMRRYAWRAGAFHDAHMLARLREAHWPAADDAPPASEPLCPSSADRFEVLVRGSESDDWEETADIFTGSNVIRHTLQLPYMSRDEVRDRMENPPPRFRGLVAVVDDTVVGMLGLHLGEGRQAHVASLGMMVHADFQGRGVGTALMAAAVDVAENWLNISRMELGVFTDNAAGIALYRKFGFEIEGVMRDYAFRDGRFADTYLMARVWSEVEA